MSNVLPLSRKLTIFALESQAELLKTFRSPGFVVPAVTFPLMFYAFFGLLFNREGMDGQVPGYLLATYGVFGIMGPALFSFGADVASDREKGLLSLKLVSPMPIGAYFGARIVTALTFAALIALGLFLLAAGFGGLTLQGSQWLLTFCALLAGTLPFCAMGLWLGLTIAARSAPALVNLIYLPMAFLSGLWMPIQFFPEALQSAANVLPAYHLAQLVLKIQQLDIGGPIALHIAALAGYTVLFLMMAKRQFARMEQG